MSILELEFGAKALRTTERWHGYVSHFVIVY